VGDRRAGTLDGARRGVDRGDDVPSPRSPAQEIDWSAAVAGIIGVVAGPDGRLAVDPAQIDTTHPLAPTVAVLGGIAPLVGSDSTTLASTVQVQGPVTVALALCRVGMSVDLAVETAVRVVAERARRLLARAGHPVRQGVVLIDEPTAHWSAHPGCPVRPEEVVELQRSVRRQLEASMGRIDPSADGASSSDHPGPFPPRSTTSPPTGRGPRERPGDPVSWGIRCSGPNVDWTSLMAIEPDLVAIPVGAVDLRHAPAFAEHLDRGRSIAWGVVPVGPTPASPERWAWDELSRLWCELGRAGCDPLALRHRAVVTPMQGTSNHTQGQVERIQALTRLLATRVWSQSVGARHIAGA